MDNETQRSLADEAPDPPPSQPSRFTTIAFMAAFLAIGGLIAFAIFSIRPDYDRYIRERWASIAGADSVPASRAAEAVDGHGGSALERYNTVPAVSFVERSGDTVSLDQLRGQVWVANFIFTKCKGICPAMTARMRQLQDQLPKELGIRLVSITVDPDNDTPQVLREFAESYGADAERWLFLRSDSATVRSLAMNTFMLAVSDGTNPDEPIVHSSKFILVDRQMTIRGYYDGLDPSMQEELMDAAEELVGRGEG